MAATSIFGWFPPDELIVWDSVGCNVFLQEADYLGGVVEVVDRDLAAPPVVTAADEGKVYIPAATATGVWATHEDELAWVSQGGWRFQTPNNGLLVYVHDESSFLKFQNGWSAAGVV